MQSEKLTKVIHQSKLSLKRSNSDSSQSTLNVKSKIDSQQSCNSNQLFHNENDPCQSNVEDSLADFKSPKEEKSYKPILNKFKIDSEKVKKKIIKPKSKSRKSTSSDINQPLIESSFFKPKTTSDQNELKESVPCPLCLKAFKDDETCTNHMKTCATKNKVSFKQLLEAKKLQDRQAEERKAMGLLAAPVLPERKKGFRSKNFSTGDDPQLQLVLAMSESLYEAQQIEELEQAALLAGIPSECIKEMNNEDRKSTLQKFGFTTNKPATESTFNKPRKKKLIGPTILQTRSQEDKVRVLTERIACIITGDDALTQVQQRTDNFSEEKEPTVLRSKILKEIEKANDKLWDRSRLTKKNNNFYVDCLKIHFLQSNQKLQSESHDTKNVNNDDEYILCNDSVEYESIDFDFADDLDKEQNTSELSNMAEFNSKTYEIDFMKKSTLNWGETLNDSTESDIIVFVKDDKHIYAHKLVFYVQCSNILLDIEPNDTISHRRIKNKICWPDKDKLSTLAFLEFIYCGAIKKYTSVFDQNNLLSEVRALAKLYKVKDLFVYIRNKQNELKQVNEKESVQESNSIDLQKDVSHSKDLSIHVQPGHVTDSLTKHNSDVTPILKKPVLDNNVKKSLLAQNFEDRRLTASPDLFESENEEELIKIQMKNNTNLNIVVNVINEDEKQETEINQWKENLDDHEICSQRTLVNLSLTPSPTEDLHEALTPKCMSPETGNTKKSMLNQQDDMQIAEAVTTPKQMLPVNLNNFDSVAPSRNSPNLMISQVMENNASDISLLPEALTEKLNSPNAKNNLLTNTNFQNENNASNVASSKSNSSSQLNDCNISNAKSQEIEDYYDESIYTAVTPPKSEGMKVTLDKDSFKTVKTNLSTFLQKIKKENAKSTLSSDSEVDTPIVAKPRNPFIKRLRHDSCHLENNEQKGRKQISLLENKIAEDENTKSKRADLSTQNETKDFTKSQSSNKSQTEVSNNSLSCVTNVSKENSSKSSISDGEIEDTSVNEVDMSRYSKYKKKNKNENSIAKYRKKLDQYSERNSSKQNTNKSTEKQDSSRDSSNSKAPLRKIKKMKSKSVIEDITLVSDSDDDVSKVDSSTSSSNVSNTKNLLNNPNTEKSQAKMLSCENISSIQNDSTLPLDLIKSCIEPSNVVNSTALKKKSDNNVINLSSESEEENIYNESTFLLTLAAESDNSLKNQKIKNKETSIEKNKEMDLLNKSEKINNDVDAEISKILESSPDLSMKNGSLTTDKTSKKSKKDSHKKSNQSKKQISDSNKNNKCEVITLSPLSIISSSENDEFDTEKKTDIFNEKKDKADDKVRQNRNSSKKNIMEFDTIESGCFDDIQFDEFLTKSASSKSQDKSKRKSQGPSSSSGNRSRKSLNFEKEISNAESCKKSKSPLSKSLTSSIIHTTNKSPVLSQGKRKSRISIDDIPAIPSTSQRRYSKSKSKSPQKPSTASNLVEEDEKLDENDLPKSSPYVTPKSNRKSLQKTIGNNEGITPPLDYSTLGTPALQKELKKYGVKPLSRNNAETILRHIYNKTHVLRQKRASSTSEDEEPPPKKKNLSTGSKLTTSKERTKSNKAKDTKECLMIAEEMDYDDPDEQNNVDDIVSIKDVFYRLLHTNKNLYNKVLTYEPLLLESLHVMLKQSGLKCKINSLMDFLDEQCITFQMQNSKGNRTKKKNRS